jgi:hypothetical protein
MSFLYVNLNPGAGLEPALSPRNRTEFSATKLPVYRRGLVLVCPTRFQPQKDLMQAESAILDYGHNVAYLVTQVNT